MAVFISWSGEKSRIVAQALRRTLPLIMQRLQVFVSDEDIAAGSRWSDVLSAQLTDVTFGIVCLTRSNLASTWLNFEAGGMVNAVGRPRVAPLLIDLPTSDVPPPLSLLQMVAGDEPGVRKLIESINEAEANIGLPADVLSSSFGAFWGQINDAIRTARSMTTDADKAQQRPLPDMVAEILDIVRRPPALPRPVLESLRPAATARHALIAVIERRARDAGLEFTFNSSNPALTIGDTLGIHVRFFIDDLASRRIRDAINDTKGYLAKGVVRDAILVFGLKKSIDMTRFIEFADHLGVGLALYYDNHITTSELAHRLAPWLGEATFANDDEEEMMRLNELEESESEHDA